MSPPRKTSGGGGLRILFFCILLILLLKALAWKASKPSRNYRPPRIDRTDSSWRYEYGTTKQRSRSIEREVIGQAEPVEREGGARPADEAHDRPDH